MKCFILLPLLLQCVFLSVYAQSTINGSVHEEGGKGISAATISLQKETDSTAVKFTLTDKEGRYQFSQLKAGRYFVLVTAVGFEKKSSPVFNTPVVFSS